MTRNQINIIILTNRLHMKCWNGFQAVIHFQEERIAGLWMRERPCLLLFVLAMQVPVHRGRI